MKKINNDFKYLIWIWIVIISAIAVTYAHHGFLLIDCGREVYYPTQILLGKVLYKDIFNIYGPFAYLFNAILFKTISVNLNVLYLSGSVCAFLIVNLIYLISRKFLSDFLSFSIAIFTVSIGILNLNLFNFIFPYSYGMLYGITAFLISFLMLLKYQEKPDKIIYLYLSSFFAGLCVTSKYEFLPYILVILYTVIKIKPPIRHLLFAILCSSLMPILCFGYLFLQGLNIKDLISTLLIIKKMSQTQTLKYFYVHQGVYLHKYTVMLLLENFLKAIIPLGFLIYGFNTKKKFITVFLNILAIIIMFCWVNPAIFSFLPILILILVILKFKKIFENIQLSLLILSAITISLKSFWGLATLNYGVFFESFLLITIIATIFSIKDYSKPFGIYILITSIILGYQNILAGLNKNCLLKTYRGQFYTEQNFCKSSDELINYIGKNTKPTDKIVILPEGTFINFMTDRHSDNYYNSMIPLYFETFGENELINHFKQSKPEYIIFNNYNTQNYYFEHICNNYAFGFCNFVAQNYVQQKVIDNGLRYLIFKRKY